MAFSDVIPQMQMYQIICNVCLSGYTDISFRLVLGREIPDEERFGKWAVRDSITSAALKLMPMLIQQNRYRHVWYV
jgi:hypothetical protein